MADNLSEVEIGDIIEAFMRLDVKGIGSIDTKQLPTLMSSLGHAFSEAQLQSMINKIGVEDGKLTFSMFLDMMGNLGDRIDKEHLMDVFDLLDEDQDGLLSENELRIYMENQGVVVDDSEFKEMMLVADVDGDGQINYDDFVNIMKKP